MKERLTKRFVRWLDQGVEYSELVEALEAACVQIQKKKEKIKETAQAIAKLYPDCNFTEEEYMQIAHSVYDTVRDASELRMSYFREE